MLVVLQVYNHANNMVYPSSYTTGSTTSLERGVWQFYMDTRQPHKRRTINVSLRKALEQVPRLESMSYPYHSLQPRTTSQHDAR